jgi:hypothetical protein
MAFSLNLNIWPTQNEKVVPFPSRNDTFHLDDVLAEARKEFAAAGLVAPAEIRTDGQWHRCAAIGGRQPNDAGSYVLYSDNWPTLILNNFREGGGHHVWHPNGADRKVSAADRAEAARRIAAAKAESEAKLAKRRAEVAEETKQILEGAKLRHPDQTTTRTPSASVSNCTAPFATAVFYMCRCVTR